MSPRQIPVHSLCSAIKSDAGCDVLQGRGQGDVGTCAWGALSCRGFFLIESGTYAGKVGVWVGGRLIPSCCCFSCLLAQDQKLNSNNHAKCVASLQSLPQLCSHPCSTHCFIISTSVSSLLLSLLAREFFSPLLIFIFCHISAFCEVRRRSDWSWPFCSSPKLIHLTN